MSSQLQPGVVNDHGRSACGNDSMNSRTAAIWLFSAMNSNAVALTVRGREAS